MNIALVTNLFPPIQTGTAHWVKELAYHLTRVGHHVVVVTCRLAHEVHSEIVDGYKVFRLPSYRLPVTKLALGFEQFYLGYLPGNRQRLEEILVQERVEIVHQCGHLLDLDFLVPQVCKRLDIPAVCSIHTIIHFPRNRIVDGLMKLVDRTLVKWLSISRYQCLISLDVEIAKYIRDRYRHHNIRFVYPCIDPEVFELPTANVLEKEFPFKILSIGHVTTMRHRLDLIRAVDRLVKDGLAVELLIVGKVLDPTPVKLVEQLGLQEVVRFAGELPRQKVLELARNYHIEAHWITTPGLGTAILEAMTLGLPAMTYAYPGIYGEVPLADMENIVFATPGDIPEIASRLTSLANSPSLRAAIGKEGRKLIQDYLTWPKAIRDIESIYAEAISR